MKKLFTLFALTLATASVFAADFAPTSVYVAGDQSTLGSTWASKNQTANYFVSGDTVVFNAFLCYQSQGNGKQTWTGTSGSGSTSATWAASGCFKGSAVWFTSEAKCATTRSSRTYLFHVTNCSEVIVLADNKGDNRELYLKAYKISGGTIATVPTDSAICTVNGLQTISISGLNTADTFHITVNTNYDSNSNFYEIAFISAPAATNVATLKSISVDGEAISDFRADSLAYSVELPYGTTTVPTVTAVATQSNENVVITPAAALPGATTILVTAADGTTTKTYTVNFTVSSVQSTDATLKSLKVGTKAISGFRADSLSYNYNVAYLDTVIPEVVAEANDATATVLITQATAVPGDATVLVTAQAGNQQTYTIHFIRLAAEKKVKELMMDNWYYAYQLNDSAHADTIYAHYVAGTPAPMIYNYVVSTGATMAYNLQLQLIEVTGADQTHAYYPFAIKPVTPYVAGNDTIWFDGTEDYVVSAYGYDSSKAGYKFSKTDSDYSREWAGKTHVDIFLSEADSILLIGGSTTNRKVKVRVNDHVTAQGNLGSSANLWVPVQRTAPFCLSVISNQTSGDGAVKGIVVVHMQGGATGCKNIGEQNAPRKLMRNGMLLIEKDGVLYTVTGQTL